MSLPGVTSCSIPSTDTGFSYAANWKPPALGPDAGPGEGQFTWTRTGPDQAGHTDTGSISDFRLRPEFQPFAALIPFTPTEAPACTVHVWPFSWQFKRLDAAWGAVPLNWENEFREYRAIIQVCCHAQP